jgi:hypothetical protein
MRELWRKVLMCSVLVMLLLGSAVSVTGCKKKEPATTNTPTVEKAADKTGEAMKEAGEEAKDAAEDTAGAVKDAADKAADQK